MSALKAYKVSNDEYAEVVFAETAGKAKTKTTYLEDDFIELTACRAPEFDQYIGQEITPEIYLKHGWWWTCGSCGRSVFEENAVVVDGEVYCCDHFENLEAKAE